VCVKAGALVGDSACRFHLSSLTPAQTAKAQLEAVIVRHFDIFALVVCVCVCVCGVCVVCVCVCVCVCDDLPVLSMYLTHAYYRTSCLTRPAGGLHGPCWPRRA
jgi:hypothetical protein